MTFNDLQIPRVKFNQDWLKCTHSCFTFLLTVLIRLQFSGWRVYSLSIFHLYWESVSHMQPLPYCYDSEEYLALYNNALMCCTCVKYARDWEVKSFVHVQVYCSQLRIRIRSIWVTRTMIRIRENTGSGTGSFIHKKTSVIQIFWLRKIL